MLLLYRHGRADVVVGEGGFTASPGRRCRWRGVEHQRRGDGVEFHVTVPASQIDAIFAVHREHADSVSDLELQPWGERAFHAMLAGYRFLIAAEQQPD